MLVRAAWIAAAIGVLTSLSIGLGFAQAAVAGDPGQPNLLVAEKGRARGKIVVSASPSQFERKAAKDLQTYVRLMTGAELPITDQPPVTTSATEAVLVIGEAALAARPELNSRLRQVAKREPFVRADAILLKRVGNTIYLAGSNDRSHYFSVAELLRQWGVRWYMPGAFGESVPEEQTLEVGELDRAYAPPFEVRTFWVSWLGHRDGIPDFQLRNMMTSREELPPTGHSLGKYLKGLSAETEPALTSKATAELIAAQVEKNFAVGRNFSLGMDDRLYAAAAPEDAHLAQQQWDKYMLRWSVTDPMLELYNNVARILQQKHPSSRARIGFLAYSNMTLPPVRNIRAERSLYAELAPIDIDPIHGMDDPLSPPRHEYKEIMYRWAKVMDGRLAIYDYDQGMLVWRDLPNPSHLAFQQDVQHYRRAGVLGVNTESRMALATTFINLYLRARLLWNPDEDVQALLDDFYLRFYGPAAAPMKRYWDRIFEAWKATIVTEHEHFAAPAIYTRQLIGEIEPFLREAETAVAELAGRPNPSRNENLYRDRMRFTRLSFDVMDSYAGMIDSAATHADYATAIEKGRKALNARSALTSMNPAFTTTKLEKGYAFWPGEIQQYIELLAFTNGEKGKLIHVLPLRWAFRRDPDGAGEARGFQREHVDLSYWAANAAKYDVYSRKDYPASEWEMLRTDLYTQAQGIRHPDGQSFAGDIWYRTQFELSAADAARSPRVRFPGLFNACKLFLNGALIGERPQRPLWWDNDYRFEWDAALSSARTGSNDLALNCRVENHFGGMFRRPFIYAAP